MEDNSNKGLSGLINIGNSCYINAAIQCLSNIPILTKYFITGEYEEDINVNNRESKMCSEYYRLLMGLWEDECLVKPISFKNTLGILEPTFKNSLQHDTQEFLSIFLNLLHKGLSYEVNITYKGVAKNELDNMFILSIKTWKENFKNQYSKILELFYGQFHSNISCNLCGNISHTFDPFCILPLPITNTCETIYDCMDEFNKNEILDDNNQWKCEKCNKLSNANKKISLWKMPDILIIVLKRFNYIFSTSSKINKSIKFPLYNLNLEKYVDGYDKYKAKYDVVGIINHGGDVGRGHYYSYCKNINNYWYEYNDTSVNKLKVLKMNSAYVIFYKKNNN